ncbi:hypothetical protein RvY_13877 [Ramazzottius varieornatus]|uniref:Uncharacterized protein n=1 Tax=Ramazzottius varieornatus TaxID=947166 RepID=A0A1D1VPE9_RAMVA|nr:hypothetical protein RvY_13877 [Ramazzottius varieornatus]
MISPQPATATTSGSTQLRYRLLHSSNFSQRTQPIVFIINDTRVSAYVIREGLHVTISNKEIRCERRNKNGGLLGLDKKCLRNLVRLAVSSCLWKYQRIRATRREYD